MPSETHGAIEAVWRIESPRLIAGLVRLVRDLGLAEDLAQDALVAALEQWPRDGIPRNPGAWLVTAVVWFGYMRERFEGPPHGVLRRPQDRAPAEEVA